MAAKKKTAATASRSRRTSGGKVAAHKSSFGIGANMAAGLTYTVTALFGLIPYAGYVSFIIPLAVFLAEKKSKFVKIMVMQGFVLSIISAVFGIIITIIVYILTPRSIQSVYNYYLGGGSGALILFTTLATIISITFLVIFIILAVMSYFYKQVKMPIIGNLAEKAASKMGKNTRSRK